MGRGRTTTGMVTACVIATTLIWDTEGEPMEAADIDIMGHFDSVDGPSEEEAYLQGKGLCSPQPIAVTIIYLPLIRRIQDYIATCRRVVPR